MPLFWVAPEVILDHIYMPYIPLNNKLIQNPLPKNLDDEVDNDDNQDEFPQGFY